MSPSDRERLELAKRAYQATKPSAVEVQIGVRRARLALRRPKTRRSWLSRGLVLVVLALGSLAYAKPQAMRDFADELGQVSLGGAHRGGGKPLAASAVEREPVLRTAAVPAPSAPAKLLPVNETAVEHAPPGKRSAAESEPSALASERSKTSSAGRARPVAASKSAAASGLARSRDTASAPASGAMAITDWGRVGRALAEGDQAGALSALDQLSRSEQQSTRDKADLGRAQLLLAQGEERRACDIAQALAARPVEASIARQAAGLLKNCSR